MARTRRCGDSLVVRAGGAALLVLAAHACSGSSGATAPTAPSQEPAAPITLAVTGNPGPTSVGATIQLTATATSAGSTTDATATATWHSSNPAVADVSPTGLVTATALGTTVVTADYKGQFAGGTIAVQGGSGPIVSCGTFVGPGPFTLGADLSPAIRDCLNFSAVTSTGLDCAGHDAGSIVVSGARDFAIRDCDLHGQVPGPTGGLHNLNISASDGVTVEDSDAVGFVRIEGCAGCAVRNNRFAYPAGGFEVAGFITAELILHDGHDNVIEGNTIDGGWNGNLATYQEQGCDDGIVFTRDANIRIEDNLIVNVFDAAIELANDTVPITAVIRNNTMRHLGYTGIGAYWIAGWVNSVISGNVVSDSPNLLTFTTVGVRSRGITDTALVDNLFEGNLFRNPVNLPPHYGGLPTPPVRIDYITGGLPGTVSGNVLRNNDLGYTELPPLLAPGDGFIDGGGNICRPGGAPICEPRP